MDTVKRKKLNLAVIQRYDPNVIDIYDQSPHVCLYKFNARKQNWDKTNFAGVLFLIKRRVEPIYGCFILSRESIENYLVFLSDVNDITMNDGIIIYQTEEDAEVGGFGLWLYEEKDRQRIFDKMLRLRESSIESKSRETANADKQQPDLLQLLMKASANVPSSVGGPPSSHDRHIDYRQEPGEKDATAARAPAVDPKQSLLQILQASSAARTPPQAAVPLVTPEAQHGHSMHEWHGHPPGPLAHGGMPPFPFLKSPLPPTDTALPMYATQPHPGTVSHSPHYGFDPRVMAPAPRPPPMEAHKVDILQVLQKSSADREKAEQSAPSATPPMVNPKTNLLNILQSASGYMSRSNDHPQF